MYVMKINTIILILIFVCLFAIGSTLKTIVYKIDEIKMNLQFNNWITSPNGGTITFKTNTYKFKDTLLIPKNFNVIGENGNE